MSKGGMLFKCATCKAGHNRNSDYCKKCDPSANLKCERCGAGYRNKLGVVRKLCNRCHQNRLVKMRGYDFSMEA